MGQNLTRKFDTRVMQKWFYVVEGKRKGPFSQSELQQFAATGKLTPESLVWSEGMPNWRAAGLLDNFLQWPAASAHQAQQTTPLEPNSSPQNGLTSDFLGRDVNPKVNKPRTSTVALSSLILGIISIPLTFSCIGWITVVAGFALAVVALIRIPGPLNELRGRRLAWGGLIASILAFLIHGIVLPVSLKSDNPPSVSSSPSHPLDEAESSITSYTKGAFHGNSPEAKAMAAKFSSLIAKEQKNLFVRKGGKPDFWLTNGEFITFCQLNENNAVFLVHIPELRKYTSEAKSTLVQLAWLVANLTLSEGDSHLQAGDELIVGVKGTIIYADIVKGGFRDEKPSSLGIRSAVLEPYFESTKKEEPKPSFEKN